LVDEVLAVGDINFQKKCLGKMGDVARQGRTVVLVSHQMNQMRRLCQRVAWVDAGRVRMDGPAHEVVSAYESAMTQASRTRHEGGNAVERGRWRSWRIVKPGDEDPNVLSQFGPLTVNFTIEVNERLQRAHHGVALFNHEGQIIWGWATDEVEIEPGEHEFRYTFPMLPLRPGPYTWRVSLYDRNGCLIDYVDFVPDMIVALDSLSHPRDEWTGVLNIPSNFAVLSKKTETFVEKNG
jgi:lipopolysaccharide transport system ATP-binding protein